MSIIVASYGGQNDNAYVTHELAHSYLVVSKVFYDEWLDATTVQREASLVQGAQQIDSRRWHGSRFFYWQLLQFPRVPPGTHFPYGVIGRTTPGADFVYLATFDEYHRQQKLRVQRANAEQALWVLRTAGRMAHREDQFHGIRSAGRGVKFSESFGYGEPDQVLCPEAADYLRHYRGSLMIRRGDSASSGITS
jgi:hypothetical protein